jgi:hypothetical protein
MDPERREKGISRRKMLKSVGASAAVAWSAPVLMSVKTPAYAQASPSCLPFDCLSFRASCGPSGCMVPPGCDPINQNQCVLLIDGSCFCSLGPRSRSTCDSDADCPDGDHCCLVEPDCGMGRSACCRPCLP